MKRCWIYKIAVSRALDANRPASAWVNRHLEDCLECRESQQAQTRLTTALTASAKSQIGSPSPFLHAKIMSALDRDTARTESARPFFRMPLSVAIPAFSLFLIGVLWIWKSEYSSSTRQAAVAKPPLARSEPLASAGKGIDAGQLFAWSETLDQPLESEIHLVVADAKNALSSLRDNFLPVDLGKPTGF